MAKRINLALQGGGAHGAFTWGVLDRLLEGDEIEIAGISGTSAGALNGAALKAGLVHGDRQTARDNLDWLWEQVGAVGDMRLANWMAELSPAPAMISKLIEYSLPFSLADSFTQVFSPYSYGPFYHNPLERIARRFHYDEVCSEKGPRFFVCATNVRTGKIRVFTGAEIATEVILASACLPTLFKAVEVYDKQTGRVEAFWDGGYTGNPALFPLFAPELPRDIVVVNINPLIRREVPMTATEIQNRINEISFNSSLLRELRAIEFVHDLMAKGQLPEGAMKDVLIHMVSDDGLMNDLSVATKMVPTPSVLGELKEAGRAAAEAFLAAHAPAIGVESSVELQSVFD